MSDKSPEQIAAEWYRAGEVEKAIRIAEDRRGRGDQAWRVPPNAFSAAFAVWITGHLRTAMAKGIQIGRGENQERLAALADLFSAAMKAPKQGWPSDAEMAEFRKTTQEPMDGGD